MVEVSDSKLGGELLRLTRRCRSIDKYVSSSAGLTIDEMHCLGTLFFERPPSVKRLSELINVPPTRASKLLKALEEKELLARTLHTEDRRKEQVTLTDEGRALAQSILSLFSELGSELLGGLRKEFATDFSILRRAIAEKEEVHDGR